jgi:hypothetical protein
VLDQDRLELERGDPVVRGLEDVVGAADVGDVAVVVLAGHVAGVVVTAAHRFRVPLGVACVAGHQAERPPGQV